MARVGYCRHNHRLSDGPCVYCHEERQQAERRMSAEKEKIRAIVIEVLREIGLVE